MFKSDFYSNTHIFCPSSTWVSPTSQAYLAPSATFEQSGNCLTANILQSGLGIASVQIDTLQNLAKTVDPKWRSGLHSAYLRLCILDSLKPARCVFRSASHAGNTTVATVTYDPNPRLLHPGFVVQAPPPFDTCLIGTSKVLEFSLVDTSLLAITVDNIWTSEPAFVYDRTWAQNRLPFTLLPGEPRTLSVKFGPNAQRRYDEHLFLHSAVTGNVTVPISGIGYYLPSESVTGRASGILPVIAVSNKGMTVRENGTLELVNLLGECVVITTIISPTTVDVSSLPAGVYFYRLTTATGRILTEKIVLP